MSDMSHEGTLRSGDWPLHWACVWDMTPKRHIYIYGHRSKNLPRTARLVQEAKSAASSQNSGQLAGMFHELMRNKKLLDSWHRYERSDRMLLVAPGLTSNKKLGRKVGTLQSRSMIFVT